MATLLQDLRFAARSLLRAPGFTLIAVGTLALGIGATAAIFTVADRVVLEPLPYPRAERLVHIEHPVPGENPDWRWGLSEAGYFHFLKHNRSFEEIAVFERGEMTLGAEGSAGRARSAQVSANLFPLLGGRPALGRLLRTEDNLAANAPVSAAVLGYDYWQARFGGDAGIVGRTIRIEGLPVEVVGVAERGFHLPDGPTDLWLPAAINPANAPVNWHRFAAVGRLRDGVGVAAATLDLERLKAQFPDALPGAYYPGFIEQTGFAVHVEPLHRHVVGEVDTLLWVLLAAVGIVLLIACANVANLFLVRTESRRREASIRMAVGASARDLAGRYLAEGLIVSMLAAALALVLAEGGTRLLLAVAPESLPRLSEISLGARSVAFTVTIALAAGLLFGLLPMLRTQPSFEELRQGTRGASGSRRQGAARAGLVVGQVALALVVLTGAALMLRSYQNLRAVDPGFDASGVLTAELALPAGVYRTDAEVASFHRELASRVGSLPGVVAVGATQVLPLKDGAGGCALVFTDDPAAEQRNTSCFAQPVRVAPGYFAAMGIPVRGAEPAWTDVENLSGGVVVSRAFAERLWPGEDPIGRGVRGNTARPPYYRIVGVADDVRAAGLDAPPVEQLYFPMQEIEGAGLWGAPLSMTLAVRTGLDRPESMVGALRAAIAAIDAGVAVGDVRTMEQIVARSMARTSFVLLLLGLAAAVALLLGVVGLYGVMSYVVAQRTAEIGVRMALGARIEQIAAMVLAQSGRLAVLGIALGLAGSLASTRALRSLLFEVSPTDPLVLGAVSLLLVTVTLLAAYLPARRAARVDPNVALRSE